MEPMARKGIGSELLTFFTVNELVEPFVAHEYAHAPDNNVTWAAYLTVPQLGQLVGCTRVAQAHWHLVYRMLETGTAQFWGHLITRKGSARIPLLVPICACSRTAESGELKRLVHGLILVIPAL
jgi:hypothetical protein